MIPLGELVVVWRTSGRALGICARWYMGRDYRRAVTVWQRAAGMLRQGAVALYVGGVCEREASAPRLRTRW